MLQLVIHNFNEFIGYKQNWLIGQKGCLNQLTDLLFYPGGIKKGRKKKRKIIPFAAFIRVPKRTWWERNFSFFSRVKGSFRSSSTPEPINLASHPAHAYSAACIFALLSFGRELAHPRLVNAICLVSERKPTQDQILCGLSKKNHVSFGFGMHFNVLKQTWNS